ncbi:MAG TPA: FGGY family carbohydrate kinase [Thermomicrobiales bacterium]|nr:FGGY family carbohydrate kinase [Thermomicrobiales bacterium]
MTATDPLTPPAVVTVDVGSGSCRALVFDAAGTLRGLAQREWLYHPAPGAPGGYDFDTQDGWAQVGTCVREAMAAARVAPADVAAVTAASMREGFVLYDDDGREIWACPNIDARAGREATEMIAEGLAERQYRRGGDWTSITAPARLRWIRRHQPDTLARARHLTMLGDWVIARLSGVFCTDPSLGSSSNLFDLAERTWSPASARELDLPDDLLPPIFEAGSVVGAVTPEAADATGLAAGTAVVAGGADTQLALLAAGLTTGLRFATVGGTFWQSAAITNEPVIDPEIRLRTLCHVQPGAWMIEGIGFLHGLSTRWVRDALLRAADPSIGPDAGYETLERLAADVPSGANGLTYLSSNVMEGRRWRHGPPSLVALDILQPQRTGLGAIFRAVEEEAAYVARGHYDILTEVCGVAPEGIRFVGGPARGRLWPQIVADVLGVPVETPPVREATSFGAALCALVGAGVYADLPQAVAATSRLPRCFEPDPAAHAVYDEAYERWRALNAHLLAAADQALAPHLWRGAGA